MSVIIDGTNGITSSGDLTLNNGAADGAQVTLTSSGYSNWNLDNYSGRFRAYYNATEYFTITNTGNVGIGITSIATNGVLAKTAIAGQNFTNSNETGTLTLVSTDSFGIDKGGSLAFTFKYNTAGGYATGARIYGAKENATDGNFAGYLGFATESGGSPVERMRIDSSGNVLVGAITRTGVSGLSGKLYSEQSASDSVSTFYNTNATPFGLAIGYSNAPNGTSSEFLFCRDSSAQRASIRSNGGLANFSANNVNLSDERLKTDITPAKSYLDIICSIPVVTFKYKDQTDEELNLGVIAQSVDAVAPELVDHSGFGEAPEGESPYLAVYQTDLQYALMKCIQEQQELIKALTSRIETLEAK